MTVDMRPARPGMAASLCFVVSSWAVLRLPAALPRRLRNPYAWALGALMIAGGALRLHYLGAPMRYDEAFTFDNYAVMRVGDITSTYNFPNNHILYTLLVHFTWRLFGNHV